jgi:uncharacterized protein
MRHAQGGRCLLPLLLLMAALVHGPVEAQAEPRLPGQWIGGFDGAAGTVAVDVTFTGDQGLTGVMSLPQRAEWNITLERVRQRGGRVSFELPGAIGNLFFEGRFKGDGRIEGSVRQGLAHSSFELHSVAVLPPADMAGLYGTYERSDGHVFLVAPGDTSPVYVDYASGRTGVLFALGRDRLIGGPTMGTGYPIAVDITFERDPGGVARRARLTMNRQRTDAVRRTFYEEEDVSFPSGAETIAGTLLRPVRPGPHPALVMIHGSGPMGRNSLRPLADHLARNGVAVLITDKRGVGRSTGRWARATFDDLADDALAGVSFLRGRPDILPYAVGLQGRSLGGWVAPLAAVRSADVAFVVVEAAPTLTPLEHERLRVYSQLRADGFERQDVARALALLDLKFSVARSGEGWERLLAEMARAKTESWIEYINPPASLESLRWYWDHVLSYDPIPALTSLRVPMLVLYGDLDTIVPPRVHRQRMEEAVRAAGGANVTIREFARANHGFFEAITGGRAEQPQLSAFVDGYFDARTDWVLARVREAATAWDLSPELQD